MRLSYNLLKQYVDLNDVTPKKLADAITSCGLEVEGIEVMASGTKLVIGYVEKCIDHPDSDHLHVCTVNTGTDVRQIVCGAPNVGKGQKVIVALPGCVLPQIEIKAGVIRGQESNGMICSLSELGVDKKQLTEEQLSGIEVLPDDAVVGNTEVLKYLSLDDTILDVGLTPNRNDCLAMWSMAKEVGAILNREVKIPNYSYSVEESITNLVIKSETEKCPLFIGKIINELEIKESPKWIKDALQGAGIKAINNVVDISNLVMLETGQPLHFYDLAKIPEKEITVVQGLEESYTALDGIEYNIKPNDIMISTDGKAIGIAGIMGGDDSKIDESTKGIIIEAALFDAVCIRNTSRRLNLQTEAAMHFTKGVEPLAGVKAVERSVQLLLEYASAKGIEKTVVCGKVNDELTKVSVSLKKVNAVLGTNFTIEEAIEPLKRLDFNPTVDGDIIISTIPTYRTDIKIAEDIIEEIIRIRGFEHISSTLPVMPTIVGTLPHNTANRRQIKSLLNGLGLNEIITYSLVSHRHIAGAIFAMKTPVELSNPMSDERRYYRTALLPSMLDTIAFNNARSQSNWGMYETGAVFDNDGSVQERLTIAFSNYMSLSRWQKVGEVGDFFNMKGKILGIFEMLGFNESRITFKVNEVDKDNFHPLHSATVYLGKDLLGIFGEVHPSIVSERGIEKCMIAELDLSLLYASKPSRIKYTPVGKYPSVTHDIAILVDETVSADAIVSTIRKYGGKLLQSAEIFDVYQGKGIEESKKSVAISLVYQSLERTLSEQDITPVQEEILAGLDKALAAQLR